MRLLLIGGGGREHALAWKIAGSRRVSRWWAAPGSAAIGTLTECVSLPDASAIVEFAVRERVDLVVVGPEAPLVDGLADALSDRAIAVFGPSKAAAQLEGSKAFAKAFMARHGIPTAESSTFQDMDAALAHVESAVPPYVVKADGLAAGKGVLICHDQASGRAAVRRIMAERAFGAAGSQVVIERFLHGEEASFFVISDGRDFVLLPSAQDHKTIGELDQGPNTGGMGAYCPAAVVTPEVERRVIEDVVRPTLRGMAAEGHPYRGVLYVGLMIDHGRPSVVEFNCRFGDPECQPQMLLLESDLVELLEAAAQGRIAGVQPRWRTGAAACIVMASGGYPGDFAKGLEITGLDQVQPTGDCQVFHAGTARDGTRWVTQGGRVLGVTAWGGTLADALARGYRAAEAIHWKGAVLRRDIGLKGLRHEAGKRPGVNVGVLAPDAVTLAAHKNLLAGLEHLGLGVRSSATPAGPAALRGWLRDCEEAGAEVFIALAGSQAGFAGQVAAMTAQPVIGVANGSPGGGSKDRSGPGPEAVHWAAGGPAQAAVLAAQILGMKYLDVRASLMEWRLEQELSGRPAPRGAGSPPPS
jgi:phosphoribosylamine--glycine ligase